MSKSKSAVAGVIPRQWRDIIQRPKTVLGWPPWSDVAALPTGKNVRLRRDDVHTVSAEITEVLFQLADDKGIGLEGVRLRFKAWAYSRHRDVTATLEVIGGRSFVTMSRIDAWPSDPHRNSFKVLKTPSLRTFAQEIQGCTSIASTTTRNTDLRPLGPAPRGTCQWRWHFLMIYKVSEIFCAL